MSPSTDGFRWRQEGTYLTVTGEAFAKKVAEEGLKVEGPFGGYLYAARKTEDGHELWRTFVDWDSVPIQQASGANPAAGANPTTITCPAGKRRLMLSFSNSIVTDANVANRYPYLEVRRDATGVAHVHTMQGTPITASINAQGVSFVANGSTGAGAIGAGLTFSTGFGEPIELIASGYVQLKYLGIQATDDAGAVTYAYKEIDAG